MSRQPIGNTCWCGCGTKTREKYVRSHRPAHDPLASVHKTASCWLWTGRLNADGYGVTKALGRSVSTHRLMWLREVGPIADGMELDHLCRVRACCNPAHLEAVTHRENVLRGVSPSALHARKTHCKKGHPFDDANTRRYPNRRVCKTCEAAAQKRYKARLRGEAA